MRFLSLLASAALASANSVIFWTLDTAPRTIYFTPNSPQMGAIAPVRCDHNAQVTVSFPEGWQGNFYAVQDGRPNKPGMLGEVAFGGWNGLTYFDVSAIVEPSDQDNVAQMWPMGQTSPMSGCNPWPCDNAYWHPDDVQTKATNSREIMCTLGKGSPGINFS